MKTLNKDQALYCAKIFNDYFGQFNRIDEYMRDQKMSQLNDTISASLPGMGPETEIFDNFDMSPQDMDFEIVEPDNTTFDSFLNLISSHTNMSSVPGKNLKIGVKEKNTNKWVGFIRCGSPVINMKPRNVLLGNVPELVTFNKTSIMGFVIVPSQPFGYNYLGGKLLALMCVSHYAREQVSKVFEKDIALFETTSLYGSTTSASQYDGLKPFIRYKGLTDSQFTPLLHKESFHKLHNKFKEWNHGEPLTENRASSKKMKRQNKMISIIRNSLKDEEKLNEFNSIIQMAFGLTQRKRAYVSDYGYQNVREVILGEHKKLIRGQNWEKFEYDNIIKWWKKKAGKRYEKLKSEGRFRTEVELWTEDQDIQIIR